MKKIIFVLTALALVGCASRQAAVEAPPVSAISGQKLVSSFKRQNIKFEWECAWGTGITDSTCVRGDIKAIEVTAYAISNGNTENMRELAFRVAETQAKAKLRHFLYEDVTSNRVINTLSKNVEKANDRVKTQFNRDEVAMSDDEASKDTNWAVRENSNNVVRDVVESVRSNASGILRGVYTSNEEIVDRQTVAVTIRWDKKSDEFSRQLRRRFGN